MTDNSAATEVVAPAEPATEPAPEAPLLVAPADGTPEVVATPERLDDTVATLLAGTGPLAVDAERAHGFRYTQRAYLIQLRREGAGTHLVDPTGFDGTTALAELGASIADAEWIIHAASQDLPCLAEQGLRPDRLFDTELAARVSGLPRVGLAAVLEELLGVTLAKEHSAADWSVRPLPEAMLTYAALDVELLVPLREALIARLEADGISTRVVDLRWLAPLPVADVLREANATGRTLLVDETRASGGVSEGVLAALVDNGYAGALARVASEDSFIPLGDAALTVLLSEDQIEAAARTLTS